MMSPIRNQKHNQPSFSTNTLDSSATTKTIKPPRPMNCFLLYRHEKQKEILSQCPGANHRDISKIIAKWWRQATPEEKEPYVKKATLEKIKHARQYPAYKFMPQKKSKNGTRTYKRRTQDEFTSKCKELNDCMKILYDAGDTTATPIAKDDLKPVKSSATTTPVSMPTISVNMLSSLLLPPVNNSVPHIMNMSSPSCSSLSVSSISSSPSSAPSPYYHHYAYSDNDIYLQQDTMATSSLLGNGNTSTDCAFYTGGGHDSQIPMDTFSLPQSCNDDVTNMYVPGDYFYQLPQQQDSSLIGNIPTSCPGYIGYGPCAYPDIQNYQQQYIEQTLSPSDIYMDTSLTNQDYAFATACSPNSFI